MNLRSVMQSMWIGRQRGGEVRATDAARRAEGGGTRGAEDRLAQESPPRPLAGPTGHAAALRDQNEASRRAAPRAGANVGFVDPTALERKLGDLTAAIDTAQRHLETGSMHSFKAAVARAREVSKRVGSGAAPELERLERTGWERLAKSRLEDAKGHVKSASWALFWGAVADAKDAQREAERLGGGAPDFWSRLESFEKAELPKILDAVLAKAASAARSGRPALFADAVKDARSAQRDALGRGVGSPTFDADLAALHEAAAHR